MPSIIYSYYMSGLIQSLPSPSSYSGAITHTWLGESWMVDVEALVIMMAMISSVSPSRQGARTEFLVPGIGFLVVAAQRTCFAKISKPPHDFTSRRSYRRKGRPRRCRRRPDATLARPGLARAGVVSGPLRGLLFPSLWVRGSSGKIGLLAYFLGFFPKVDFLHKNKTPGQLC